ncbi:MAG: NUDIX domain-containing protein [Candidatus Komeilibacteria bacterium]
MSVNQPQYAGVLLVTNDGQLMLQQRDTAAEAENPGTISFFGGAVEPNEQPIEAALREIEEELNLKLQPNDLTFFRQYRKTLEQHGKEVDCYIYLAKNIDPTKASLNEGEKIIYIRSLAETTKLKLSTLAQEVISDYFIGINN